MQKLILFFLISFSSLLYSAETFIVAGQSNSWRLSHVKAGSYKLPHKLYYFGMHCVSEPTQAKLRIFDSISNQSMALGLVVELMEKYQDDIVLIQYSRCGAGVWHKAPNGWYPGDSPQAGEVYNEGLCKKFEQYINSAEATLKEYKIDWKVNALFWHQGESDSRKTESTNNYEKNLTNVFFRFEKAIGHSLPIIMGEIRELHENTKKINATLSKIAKSSPNKALVKTQDLSFVIGKNGRKDVHFDLDGAIALGQRMVQSLNEIRLNF